MRMYMKENIVCGCTVELMIVSTKETIENAKDKVRVAINNINYIDMSVQSTGSLAKILYDNISEAFDIEYHLDWLRVWGDKYNYSVEYP